MGIPNFKVVAKERGCSDSHWVVPIQVIFTSFPIEKRHRKSCAALKASTHTHNIDWQCRRKDVAKLCVCVIFHSAHVCRKNGGLVPGSDERDGNLTGSS